MSDCGPNLKKKIGNIGTFIRSVAYQIVDLDNEDTENVWEFVAQVGATQEHLVFNTFDKLEDWFTDGS